RRGRGNLSRPRRFESYRWRKRRRVRAGTGVGSARVLLPAKGPAMKMTCCSVFLLFLLTAPEARAAENKTRPGELLIDPPTLINLGFEWRIEGDDNRSAKVEVSYRKQGETQWKQGLPLFRLQGEQIYQGQGVFDVVSPNMFAGSVFDLEPDTAYEV